LALQTAMSPHTMTTMYLDGKK